MSAAETCVGQPEAAENGVKTNCSGENGFRPSRSSTDVNSDCTDGDSIMLLEPRSFRPFKTSEEYLYAMKEDLAEWLNSLYNLDINVDNFFERLETGEILCAHANNVRRLAEERRLTDSPSHQQHGGRRFSSKCEIPQYDVVYRQDVTPGSFFARDNVHNFIAWCRDLGIYEVLLFETDDLVLRKNEKHVILSLLEVARRGARFGMAAPLLVQMEADIDREMEQERLAEEAGLQGEREADGWSSTIDLSPPEPPKMFYGPQAQIITNDLKSLDEMVRDLVERCSCPSQFPMVKVSEGKYRIGDTRVLIFVRILRNHVMVRVGGGWDTLEHYLDKHDPCRCRQGHRVAMGSRVGFKTSSSGQERQLMNVTYERKRSAGGKVLVIQSTTEKLTMQQALERGREGLARYDAEKTPKKTFEREDSLQKTHIREDGSQIYSRHTNMSPGPSYEQLKNLESNLTKPSKSLLPSKNDLKMMKADSIDSESSPSSQNHHMMMENIAETQKNSISNITETPTASDPQIYSPSTPLSKRSQKIHTNIQRTKNSINRDRSSSLPLIVELENQSHMRSRAGTNELQEPKVKEGKGVKKSSSSSTIPTSPRSRKLGMSPKKSLRKEVLVEGSKVPLKSHSVSPHHTLVSAAYYNKDEKTPPISPIAKAKKLHREKTLEKAYEKTLPISPTEKAKKLSHPGLAHQISSPLSNKDEKIPEKQKAQEKDKMFEKEMIPEREKILEKAYEIEPLISPTEKAKKLSEWSEVHLAKSPTTEVPKTVTEQKNRPQASRIPVPKTWNAWIGVPLSKNLSSEGRKSQSLSIQTSKAALQNQESSGFSVDPNVTSNIDNVVSDIDNLPYLNFKPSDEADSLAWQEEEAIIDLGFNNNMNEDKDAIDPDKLRST